MCARFERERRHVLEDLRGERAQVLERQVLEVDTGFGFERAHHRVAQLVFAGEVPVDGALVHARPLGDAANGQRPPVPDREVVQELGARRDDALARFRRTRAPQRTVVRSPRS